MTLNVAEQRQVADIVRTGAHLLNLDAIWTAGLRERRPASDIDRTALIKVGSDMASDLISIRARQDFLIQCAGEIEELTPDGGSFSKHWQIESEGSLPELLRKSVLRLQADGPAEVENLLTQVDSLQRGSAAEADLSEKIKEAIIGVIVSLSSLIWMRHGIDPNDVVKLLAEEAIKQGIMRLHGKFWP